MPPNLPVRVRLVPGASSEPAGSTRELDVPPGWTLRDVLRELGLPVEGCALWWNGEPVPSDLPVTDGGELEVVSTFSGG